MNRTLTIDGETFEISPMDHGGYVATYQDMVLAATDGAWIAGSLVDWNTDEGENEVRWPTIEAAEARVRETCRMN